MSLDALLIFAKAIEAGSFSSAARRLNIPVSTVSRKISELEERLGIRLVERSTRRLCITHVGSAVLEHAQQTAEHMAAIKEIVARSASGLSGSLRVATQPWLATHFAAPLVTSFQSTYPRVRIDVLVRDQPMDHVADEIDIALCVGPLVESALIQRKIGDCHPRTLASPDYLARRGTPECPAQLGNHNILSLCAAGGEPAWDFSHADGGESCDVRLVPALTINDMGGLIAALLAGAGIAQIPIGLCEEHLLEHRLVQVLPNWRMRATEVFAVRLAHRHVRLLVQQFSDFAAGYDLPPPRAQLPARCR